MDLQARVAAITQSVMAWHIARDCEINFNGRGNDSQETGCFGEMGPPQGPGPGTFTAPSTGTCKLEYPFPLASTASCGGNQTCSLQAKTWS